VHASGTKGMRVVVLDSPTPKIFLDEGRLAVEALRRIGYRARLKLLPDDLFVRIAGNTDKVHSNLQSGGWAADYPAASDFIQLKLSCSAFHPGSDSNPNSGGFCSPRMDRKIERARRLQVTDPLTANRLWARIDRTLVDQAVWLPLVTPTNTTFVSARVGNYRYHPLWGPLIDQFWVR
jgi:peptide/nickel transport system substrate-binding protein